jgi:hypothetical protein
MPNATPLPLPPQTQTQTAQAATVQHPSIAPPQYNFIPSQFRAGQDQQHHAMMMSQMPQYQQMYASGYTMGYNVPNGHGRMPPGYAWAAGRGVPSQVNGQGGVGVGGQQQMQMAVGKPTQGAGR